MKKSDFVEVYVYFPTEMYSAGILYSLAELKNNNDYELDGKTLLTKEFFEKHCNKRNKIDLSYIE